MYFNELVESALQSYNVKPQNFRFIIDETPLSSWTAVGMPFFISSIRFFDTLKSFFLLDFINYPGLFFFLFFFDICDLKYFPASIKLQH